MREAIFDYVTSTLRSGCDQAQEVFELARARQNRAARLTGRGTESSRNLAILRLAMRCEPAKSKG